MLVGKRIFPYPTLNVQKNLSSYKETMFDFNFDVKQIEEDLIIDNIQIQINNDELNLMIKNDIISLYILIECSSSIYRQIFKYDNNLETISLNIRDFKGKTQVSCYGVANDEIYDFRSADFVDEYQGFSFNIHKHNILIIDDGKTFPVQYDEDYDKVISSIFNVIKNIDGDQKLVSIDIKTRTIDISLPEKQYKTYENFNDAEETKKIFFSILLIPALVKGLNLVFQKILADEFDDIDDIKTDFEWFNSVVARYKEIFKTELTIEDLKEKDMFELAQGLIDYPIIKSVDEIYDYYRGGDDEDEN